MFKKILVLSLIMSFIGLGSLNVNANELIIEDGENFCYEVDLRGTGITMDKIKQMSLGEYYRTIFPEAWDKFTEEEKEEYNSMPYPDDIENRSSVNIGTYYLGVSTLQKTSKYVTAETTSMKKLLSTKPNAKSIKHSMIIAYEKGHGVAGQISSTSKNTQKYYTSLNKATSTFTKGKKYRAETVHTISVPEGVNAITVSNTSRSAWMTIK